MTFKLDLTAYVGRMFDCDVTKTVCKAMALVDRYERECPCVRRDMAKANRLHMICLKLVASALPRDFSCCESIRPSPQSVVFCSPCLLIRSPLLTDHIDLQLTQRWLEEQVG